MNDFHLSPEQVRELDRAGPPPCLRRRAGPAVAAFHFPPISFTRTLRYRTNCLV